MAKVKKKQTVKKIRIPADVNYLIPTFHLQVQHPTYPLLKNWIQPPVTHLDDFSEQVLSKIEPSLRLKIGHGTKKI